MNTSQPSRGSWIRVSSSISPLAMLTIEPYGIAWEIMPSDIYYVFICEDNDSPPEIVFHQGAVQVFCAQAIVYQNGVEIFNYCDLDVPLPEALSSS